MLGLKTDTATATDPQKNSELYNSHFIDIGPNLASNLPYCRRPTDYMQPTNTSFELKNVTSESVLKLLSNLNVNKATGLDNIPGKLIKEAGPTITDSLCLIFNRSIDTGVFPEDWKLAKVTPVYNERTRKTTQVNINQYLLYP